MFLFQSPMSKRIVTLLPAAVALLPLRAQILKIED